LFGNVQSGFPLQRVRSTLICNLGRRGLELSRLLDGGAKVRVVIVVFGKRSCTLRLLRREQPLSRSSCGTRIAARIRDARSQHQAKKMGGTLEENTVALSRCSSDIS